MEDFVNFDLAKKLKEKGIPQGTSVLDECDYTPRPTTSQVLKWLREEKKIVFGISPMQEMDCDYIGWCVTIYKVDDNGYGLSWIEELYYESYERAALAGIEYCLDNLI